jgi:hypothetical protein
MFVVEADLGWGVIRKGRQETVKIPEKLTYDLLEQNPVAEPGERSRFSGKNTGLNLFLLNARLCR